MCDRSHTFLRAPSEHLPRPCQNPVRFYPLRRLKKIHPRVLYAAALANAADATEKARYLNEAAARFDAAPVALKQLKQFAMVRADIAAEMRK